MIQKFYATVKVSDLRVLQVKVLNDDSELGLIDENTFIVEITQDLFISVEKWMQVRGRDEAIYITDINVPIIGEEHVDYDFLPEPQCTAGPNPVSISIDPRFSLSGLPNPTVVNIPLVGRVTVTDGFLDIVFDYPGTYNIYIEPIGDYSSSVLTIEVTE